MTKLKGEGDQDLASQEIKAQYIVDVTRCILVEQQSTRINNNQQQWKFSGNQNTINPNKSNGSVICGSSIGFVDLQIC